MNIRDFWKKNTFLTHRFKPRLRLYTDNSLLLWDGNYRGWVYFGQINDPKTWRRNYIIKDYLR